jgi:hypothetical protein
MLSKEILLKKIQYVMDDANYIKKSQHRTKNKLIYWTPTEAIKTSEEILNYFILKGFDETSYQSPRHRTAIYGGVSLDYPTALRLLDHTTPFSLERPIYNQEKENKWLRVFTFLIKERVISGEENKAIESPKLEIWKPDAGLMCAPIYTWLEILNTDKTNICDIKILLGGTVLALFGDCYVELPTIFKNIDYRGNAEARIPQEIFDWLAKQGISVIVHSS